MSFTFFFFNDTATTEIYTLSLHDALPILAAETTSINTRGASNRTSFPPRSEPTSHSRTSARKKSKGSILVSKRMQDTHLTRRSEEHTSELQSQSNLVCRLLLEKQKANTDSHLRPHVPTSTLLRRRPDPRHIDVCDSI